MITPNRLAEIKAQYGEVVELPYKFLGNSDTLIVRKPRFSEYVFFNKYSIKDPRYTDSEIQLDPEVADIYLSKVTVYPDILDFNKIPAGIVMEACVASVNLHKFESEAMVRDMYVKSIRNANTTVGVIVQRLIAAFGIQGYLTIAEMNEEEVMDLIVYSENLLQESGWLSKLCSIKDIPMIRRGKQNMIDIKRLFGITPPPQQKAQEFDRSRYHHAGIPDSKLDEILNQQNETPKGEETAQNNDRLNTSTMSDSQMETMNYREYLKKAKEGKINTFQDNLNAAWQVAKDQLAEKIAEDESKYGPTATQPKLTGEKIESVISSIRDHIRNGNVKFET